MAEISIRTMLGRIRVFDDETYCAESEDGDHTYEFVHRIPSTQSQSTTVFRGIQVHAVGVELSSCLVILPGSTGLSHSNALVRSRILYIGSEITLCGLDARELSLLWSLDLPSGFANGLYFPPLERSVIAIGSNVATCVEADGTIRWSRDLPETPEGRASLGEYHINVGFRSGIRSAIDYRTGDISGIRKA